MKLIDTRVFLLFNMMLEKGFKLYESNSHSGVFLSNSKTGVQITFPPLKRTGCIIFNGIKYNDLESALHSLLSNNFITMQELKQIININEESHYV